MCEAIENMESNWDSASFPAGTMECLLCRKSLEYVNGDRSHIMEHLNNVHSTKIHHNLILAITFLENKTLNKIISQFEKHSKLAEEQKVDTDEDVVEEMEVENDNSIVEIVEENEDSDDDISVLDIVEENDEPVEIIEHPVEIIEQPELEENLPEENNIKGIDYDEIIENFEYFKNNPKQMTTNLNPDLHSGDLFPLVDPNLPSGWKVRDHNTKTGDVEKHYLAPDGRVIKSKRAVIEYMKIMEKYSVENIITISQPEEQPVFGDLWNHLSSNDTSSSQNEDVKYDGRRRHNGNVVLKELSFGKKSESVSEVRRKRTSGSGKSESVGETRMDRRSGSGKGKECPECHKVVSMLETHIEDMHSPPGHFPCRGCAKVFTSKNKESSHFSRNCRNRVKT